MQHGRVRNRLFFHCRCFLVLVLIRVGLVLIRVGCGFYGDLFFVAETKAKKDLGHVLLLQAPATAGTLMK